MDIDKNEMMSFLASVSLAVMVTQASFVFKCKGLSNKAEKPVTNFRGKDSGYDPFPIAWKQYPVNLPAEVCFRLLRRCHRDNDSLTGYSRKKSGNIAFSGSYTPGLAG